MINLPDSLNNARVKALVLLLLAGLLVSALWPAFQAPGQPEDEGIALLYPEMILKGRLPYRDFECIYGPGNFLTLSAAYSVFGTNIFVERGVGLIYRLLILLAIFGVAQRWGTFVASACALVAVVLLGHSEVWANTWFAAIAFALCGLWMMANVKSSWRCFAAGRVRRYRPALSLRLWSGAVRFGSAAFYLDGATSETEVSWRPGSCNASVTLARGRRRTDAAGGQSCFCFRFFGSVREEVCQYRRRQRT